MGDFRSANGSTRVKQKLDIIMEKTIKRFILSSLSVQLQVLVLPGTISMLIGNTHRTLDQTS